MTPAAWCLVAAALLIAGPVARPSGGGGDRLRRTRVGRVAGDAALPLVLDLAAAALRAGRPPAEALELAAPAGDERSQASLVRVARLLSLGADPQQAWSAATGPVASLAPVAVRSAASGTKLATAFERLADDVRSERSAVAAARAQRAGVLAMAPLAACFLPSFVCLGVVPTVVGVAATALNHLV